MDGRRIRVCALCAFLLRDVCKGFKGVETKRVKLAPNEKILESISRELTTTRRRASRRTRR
jgi:hypothetical protein